MKPAARQCKNSSNLDSNFKATLNTNIEINPPDAT